MRFVIRQRGPTGPEMLRDRKTGEPILFIRSHGDVRRASFAREEARRRRQRARTPVRELARLNCVDRLHAERAAVHLAKFRAGAS